jgi:Kef-type K+ transport system membrane component KefB
MDVHTINDSVFLTDGAQIMNNNSDVNISRIFDQCVHICYNEYNISCDRLGGVKPFSRISFLGGKSFLGFPLLFCLLEECRMEKTLLDIALILVATKLAGIVSRKFKMPEVLGALIAGIILGPVVLNAVQYDNNIQLLSNLGVIILLFLAGLETNVEEFKKAGKSAFMIALFGVLFTLILGTLGAFLFYRNLLENMFIGTIFTATSVSIAAQTLTELGKLDSRAGTNILGAAVIDDILSLLLISVLLATCFNIKSTGKSYSLFITLAGIALFCLVGICAILFLPKIFNKLLKNTQPSRTLLTFSLAGALIAAFLAEKLGLAAITGAYLCGMMFSQFTHKEYLERNVKTISSGFLSLIFFASIGIEANLKGFNIRVLLMTLIIFIIAVIGKVVGCGSAARIFKIKRSESLQIGIGMISRGEVEIIIANIGLQNHIITQEVFIPTIIVIILTNILTPVLLKLAFTHKNEMRIETHTI